MKIIGYIHICQIGDWKRSFKMIMDRMISSGLYSAVSEIRCGVVSNNGRMIPDEVFNNPKIKIVCEGRSQEYERPTLLHMKREAEDARYFYFHTKGLRWFNTPSEPCVVDWIHLLLYWNVDKWRDATKALESHDAYGCNYYCKDSTYPPHYSGNFFWTTGAHLNRLPSSIGGGYNDPEFWICLNHPNAFNAFSSGLEGMGHYTNPFPERLYRDQLE